MIEDQYIQPKTDGAQRTPLRFLGVPVLDAGLVTFLIYSNKEHPSELTYSDWVNCLDIFQEDYEKYWGFVLDIAYTSNAFNNTKWTKEDERRKEEILALFALAKGQNPPQKKGSDPRPAAGTPCIYYPEEKAVILAAGNRIPMFTRKGMPNFTPNGEGYLPISSWALGCILAFIYTTPIIYTKHKDSTLPSRLLLVHTLSPKLLLKILSTLKSKYVDPFLVLSKIKKDTNEYKEESEGKYYCPLTLFSKALNDILSIEKYVEDEELAPITIICFRNTVNNFSFEKHDYIPAIHIFLRKMNTQRFRDSWNALVQSYWEYDENGSRNLLYKKLPIIQDSPSRFVSEIFREYVFKKLLRRNRNGRKRENSPYVPIWDIVEFFCTNFVSHMSAHKIEKIRSLAEKIASVIVELDGRFLKHIMGIDQEVNQYGAWRRILIDLNFLCLKNKRPPLLTLDDFLAIFGRGRGDPHSDWFLSRDLIQIAVPEELYKRGYFEKQPEEHEEETDETFCNRNANNQIVK